MLKTIIRISFWTFLTLNFQLINTERALTSYDLKQKYNEEERSRRIPRQTSLREKEIEETKNEGQLAMLKQVLSNANNQKLATNTGAMAPMFQSFSNDPLTQKVI